MYFSVYPCFSNLPHRFPAWLQLSCFSTMHSICLLFGSFDAESFTSSVSASVLLPFFLSLCFLSVFHLNFISSVYSSFRIFLLSLLLLSVSLLFFCLYTRSLPFLFSAFFFLFLCLPFFFSTYFLPSLFALPLVSSCYASLPLSSHLLFF